MKVSAELRHHHMFGCPVYVLDSKLQSGKSLKAWLTWARVGINLGILPTHARSVTLVLSRQTGLVSPQFHTLAVIGASRHDATILGRVTSRHASHVMTRHRLAVLHPLFTKRF
jgi:hypothetical protein